MSLPSSLDILAASDSLVRENDMRVTARTRQDLILLINSATIILSYFTGWAHFWKLKNPNLWCGI